MNYKDIQQKLKDIQWESAFKRLTNPKAAGDLNRFLENMPQNTGKTMLIVAGIAWGAAGALGLFTTVQVQKLTEIRMELEEAEALKPKVPAIKDVAVDAKEVELFANKIKEIYSGLEVNSNGPTISITGTSTAVFGQFREAIGHVQSGGSGWRVNIDKFCVGRECDRHPLSASLKINKVSIN